MNPQVRQAKSRRKSNNVRRAYDGSVEPSLGGSLFCVLEAA
jgi:hypothetical protein